MSEAHLIWVMVAVAIAAFAQSLTGFGFSLLSVPLMTLAVDPKDAVVIATLIAICTTTVQAVHDRTLASVALANRLTLASFVGMPIGLVAFVALPASALRFVLGVVVIGATVVLTKGFALQEDSPKFDWTLGALSGALATSLSTNGPPLVFLLTAKKLDGPEFRATITRVFSIVNIVTIVMFVLARKVHHQAVVAACWAVPAMCASLFVGFRVRRHVHGERFRALVLVLLVLSGVSAMYGAFAH